MESTFFVEARLDQTNKVVNRMRNLVFEQLDNNLSFGGFNFDARQVISLRFAFTNLLFGFPHLLNYI